MDNYKHGYLLKAAYKQEAERAARTVKNYCARTECEECVFLDQITGACIFTKHNKYGFHKTPEDWEV